VQPLLDWGLREAEVRRNKALYQERLAQFAQAYLSAIEDVENALYLEKKHRTLIERLTSRQRILAQTLVETRNRYIQGLTDYLPVLTAVQDLRDIDREIITRTRELVQFRVRLFRALGGPVTSKSDDGLNS
jgi:outer membrane protein TolC